MKSICLLGLLAGSTLALTPEEKLGKMNAAFAEGNTAAAEKWGLEMLHDGDMTSVRLVAEYMVDCGYSPKLREAALKKSCRIGDSVGRGSLGRCTMASSFRPFYAGV